MTDATPRPGGAARQQGGAAARPGGPTPEPGGPARRATGRHRPWLAAALQRTFRPVLRLLLRMRIEGLEHVPASGGVIVAGNHAGFLDGPLVWLYLPRPVRFLVKAELYRSPPLARALGWLGPIPVHRGQPDRAALEQALGVLAAGGAVGVFPEGTRGSGVLREVHDGVAYLAVRSGCPVLPVACLGSRRALPSGGRPQLRTRVTVAFGPPVTVAPTGALRARRTVAAASQEIRQALLAHLAAAARRAGEPAPAEAS
jgi:1-acyl-sn-glycerol-3-phosphate acyltransferase